MKSKPFLANYRPNAGATLPDPVREAREALEAAEKFRQSGRLEQAQGILEALLKRHPDYVGALHTLGLVCAANGNHQQALSYLVRAAMFNPDDPAILAALGIVYRRLGAGVMAVRTLEEARRNRPDDAGILVALGEIYQEQEEFEAAAEAFEHALAADSALHPARLRLGQCCAALGDFARAAAAFNQMIADGSRSVRMLTALIQLPSAHRRDDILGLIDEAQADAGMDPAEFAAARLFARAAVLDQRGDTVAAWEALVAANQMLAPTQHRTYPRDRAVRETFLERMRQLPQAGNRASGGSDISPLSLFIVGPSRSGKSSLERLVGCFSGVKRGHESPLLEEAVKRVSRTAGMVTRDRMIDFPPALAPLFRDVYREELTRKFGPARVVTSTHPGRIFDAPGLAEVLPEARFAFVKRNRDDLALRIYMRHFSRGNSHACHISTIRQYIDWYYDMIDVLVERLGARALVVEYEEMVADPRSALERVARLCNLDGAPGPLPDIGDDRNCAAPYLDLMARAEAV